MALLTSPADTTAQLVQLREAEALGMFYNHDGGLRHIHTHFDYRGGDQDLCFAIDEGGHGSVLISGTYTAMY